MDTIACCERCGTALTEMGMCPACLMMLAADCTSHEFVEIANLGGLDYDAKGTAFDNGGDARRIGPYELLELKGYGGMGEVYRAQQVHPIRRIVALKLIRHGIGTSATINRFESERQVLALMNHGNIASVYEAGISQNGRPYFVMEYVDGQPITEFCDGLQLPVRERLEIFLQVCEAVQHAHQKAIIHRDLKPTNILITSCADGKPIAKVIDFGVAKILDPRFVQGAFLTESGSLIGTREYMSPEQAFAGELDVDTRSDIYSLGVILYELLAGTLPLDTQVLRHSDPREFRQILQNEDPPPASIRLATAGDDSHVAAGNRSTVPAALIRELQRELEWIPQKAMSKAPSDRYRSAAELADDVSNYLYGRPLIAGPHSSLYRMRKFLRRYRRSTLAGVSFAWLLLSLIVALAMAARFAIQARGAALAAEQSTRLELGQKLIESGDRFRRLEVRSFAQETYLQSLAALKHLSRSQVPILARLFTTLDVHPALFDAPADVGGQAQAQRITCLAFCHDSHTVITGSQDGRIRTLDIRTGEILRIWPKVHTDNIAFLAVSPDDRYVFTAGWDRNVIMWEMASGTSLSIFPHNNSVWSVEISHDGKYIATADDHGGIFLWDLHDRAKIHEYRDPDSKAVPALAFTTDDQVLLASNGAGAIWQYHPWTTDAPERVFLGFNQINALSLMGDGRSLVAGGFDGYVTIHNLGQANSILRILSSPKGRVWRVAGSSDGRTAASGDSEGRVQLYDTRNGIVLQSIEASMGEIHGLAFSPDGGVLVAGGDNLKLRAWRARRPTLSSAADAIAITPNGLLVSHDAKSPTRLRVIDGVTQQEVGSIADLQSPVTAFGVTRDGKNIVAGCEDGTVRWLDIATGRSLCCISHGPRVSALAFAPVGAKVFVAAADGTVLACAKDSVPKSLFSGIAPVKKLYVAANSLALAALLESGQIILADSDKVSRPRPLEDCRLPVDVAFADDSTRVFVAESRGVRMYSVATGKPIGEFMEGSKETTSLTTVSQGGILWSVNRKGSLILRDSSNGSRIAAMTVESIGLRTFATSADGRFIAASAADGAVQFWDLFACEHECALIGLVREARTSLRQGSTDAHANAQAEATLSEWFALHDQDAWALELAQRAIRNGADLSPLFLGRSYWKLGRYANAAASFREARKQKLIGGYYADLCLTAIDRAAAHALPTQTVH